MKKRNDELQPLPLHWYPANQKELRTMTPSPWTKV